MPSLVAQKVAAPPRTDVTDAVVYHHRAVAHDVVVGLVAHVVRNQIRVSLVVERHLAGHHAVAGVLLLHSLLLAALVSGVPGTVFSLPPAQDRAILFRGGGR